MHAMASSLFSLRHRRWRRYRRPSECAPVVSKDECLLPRKFLTQHLTEGEIEVAPRTHAQICSIMCPKEFRHRATNHVVPHTLLH